jgi:hypothetical protein
MDPWHALYLVYFLAFIYYFYDSRSGLLVVYGLVYVYCHVLVVGYLVFEIVSISKICIKKYLDGLLQSGIRAPSSYNWQSSREDDLSLLVTNLNILR